MSNPYAGPPQPQPGPAGGGTGGAGGPGGYGYPHSPSGQYGYPQPGPGPQQPPVGYPAQPPVPPGYVPGVVQAPPQSNGYATASLVIGVISALLAIFFIGGVLACVGLGLGIAALRQAGRTGIGRTAAVGGLVLNVATIALTLAWVAVAIRLDSVEVMPSTTAPASVTLAVDAPAGPLPDSAARPGPAALPDSAALLAPVAFGG
ncbi:DUF4190 domain-containing protein [Allostreptomyces psammosilenae]|uniref:Preprotein translocase subunit SecG n=1 Tax=Allostreptomyces psammosilenae TaxID=1892865 RepID=A0A853A1F1_9ACTN|nr:DUF4190 domain-containing protein [Allostreptomyces psammosilenae]NYI07967.1 preprotein translocase subunit SecG [Allostreptomyces psammosilenae]